ncbi:hypothetical protein KUO12_22775, partial [Vibrio vulnificus]|uniref:non-specific lipid-transfer protein n=1 Tax=Vibrio vulnificus TaxID=672 RepID=UPI001CC952E1|nr:hypothetical protein [Vibrio vulnificus]
MKIPYAILFCLAAVAVTVVLVPVSEAVTCNVSQLSPCAGAITAGQKPSQACCNRLREQEPCLCGYSKNPALKQYVNSPNARKTAKSCNV